MSTKLFHQCGHNTVWNLKSHQEDKTGDGLILSPVHYKKEDIEKVPIAVRQRSLFDPQFYLPNSQKIKLQTYPFFPEVISDGFSTQNYGVHALESAKQCIDFQIENEFQYIVIPARFFDQMDPEYTTKQDSYTVIPFLESLKTRTITKKILLTLPLTQHMLKSEKYRTDLLNWVTKYPEIDGVYLFVACDGGSKQIDNKDLVLSYLEFTRELSNADLEVIVGYLNTESILFSLVPNCSVTFGSFENTRMFSIDKFIVSDEERRGPKARIFIPGLLNWIEFGQAKSLREIAPEIWEKIYYKTSHAEGVLDSPTEPTFNQPALYMHHFQSFDALFRELKAKTEAERYGLVRTRIKDALAIYDDIDSIPFDFDKHGGKGHLQAWLDGINVFHAKYLKA